MQAVTLGFRAKGFQAVITLPGSSRDIGFNIPGGEIDAPVSTILGIGLDALVERCDDRRGIGFVMYPTSVDELMAVADADERMPPKSSYFEPKPRSGVFVRRLAREGYSRSDLLPDGDTGR